MNKYCIIFLATILFSNCNSPKTVLNNKMEPIAPVKKADYTIAFGSCNKQNSENLLWDDILSHKPSVWIWGGDNIYADTRDMIKLKREYAKQLNNKAYQKLVNSTKVLGTWDDHDYGLNDGGVEFDKKQESQQLFLDFIGVSKNAPRRNREGVYHSEIINTENGSIKIIVLDTRYFRTALVEDTKTKKRYKPNTNNNGSILGETQWQWFAKELNTSKADFNIVVSSIQFLSAEHGFETWGNFPNEVDKLKQLVASSKAKGVLLLSGDRHISEFSSVNVQRLDYPLIDFTSSGLTHAYTNFTGEPNKTRVGRVVSEISFGVLKFDFSTKKITMQMQGDNNKKLQEITQRY